MPTPEETAAAAAAAGGAAAPPAAPTAEEAAATVAAAAAAAPPSQPDAAAAAAPAAAAAAGPPQTYALTLPEGTPLDATDLTAFEQLARTEGLTNDQAQAAFVKHAAAVAAHNTALRAELEADPEVGGTHLAAAQQDANAVLDRFLPATDPDGAKLRAVMTKQGLGNFAPMVKLLAHIGRAMKEDQPLGQAGGAGQGRRTAADVLFGDGNRKP